MKHIVLTRPRHHNQPLASFIKQRGHHPILLPTLTIQYRTPHLPQPLPNYDMLIFISPSSVEGLNPAIQGQLKRHPHASPTHLTHRAPLVLAMGPGTAHALERQGLRPPLIPPEPDYHTDALLTLAPLQSVLNKRLAVVTGEGGSSHLIDTLMKRGACVDKIITYRRLCPPELSEQINALFIQHPHPDYMVISSQEGLLNLCTKTPDPWQSTLKGLPLIASSDKVEQLAKLHGFTTIHKATSAANEAMIDQLGALLP